jgi:hypothetical protein
MRDVSKDVIKTLLEEELSDNLGFKKNGQKAKPSTTLETDILISLSNPNSGR